MLMYSDSLVERSWDRYSVQSLIILPIRMRQIGDFRRLIVSQVAIKDRPGALPGAKAAPRA